MLKNIVFDFGQVLVHFDPSYMVGRYVSEPDDAQLLEEVVFHRLYWDPLDAGTISDNEVITACSTRLPERLWDIASEIYFNWIYNIPEIDGMHELITYIKAKYSEKNPKKLKKVLTNQVESDIISSLTMQTQECRSNAEVAELADAHV